jgi:hypothetical protein
MADVAAPAMNGMPRKQTRTQSRERYGMSCTFFFDGGERLCFHFINSVAAFFEKNLFLFK